MSAAKLLEDRFRDGRSTDDTLGVSIDFHLDGKLAFFVDTLGSFIKSDTDKIPISALIAVALPGIKYRNLSLRHFASRPHTTRSYILRDFSRRRAILPDQ